MSNPAPLLRITDGTTHVDLIGASGFELKSWTPMRPALKGGGNRRSSPLSDGSQLVSAAYENIIDSIELLCHQSSQDGTIWERQELDRLLIKAREYWTTDWQSEPVWIEARGTYETNTRYSVIVNYEMLPDADPYSPPFAQLSPFDSTQDSLTLMLEHQFWLAEEPGTVVCVEASGGGEALEDPAFFAPAQSEDDAFVFPAASTINLNGNTMTIGAIASRYHCGVRFRDVRIPYGAKVTSAFIRFESASNLATTTVNARLVGEDNTAPAIFSTYADFMGRAHTSASVSWQSIGAWVFAATYDTPDITTIIQEIVNKSGWAHGNNLVVFIEDVASSVNARREAYQWDSGIGAEARLYVTFDVGQEPTCDRDVYVANKHNMAQLTDVYTWVSAAGPFSANLIGGALPQDLFAGGAAGPAGGDITYFGIDSTVANSGPFCSLVFDVSTAATYAGAIGVDFVTWQYWNGGWVNLTPWDNTKTSPGVGPTTQPFTETGVNSVNWAQPSDWVPTAINGVTAYWVRFVVTEGNAIGRALQANRDIYTITWANLEIAPVTASGDGQLQGDLPLLLRIIQQSVAYSASVGIFTNEIWWGLRSRWRGPDFQAYLNLSNEQNPSGVTVGVGALGAFTTNTLSSTGVDARWSAAGIAAMQQAAYISINYTASINYQGMFRVFLRYWSSTGNDGDVRGRVSVSMGGQVTYSNTFDVLVNSAWMAQDLGLFKLSYGPMLSPSDTLGTILFSVELENTIAAARVIDLMDIVLMPADEWLVKTDSPTATGLPNFRYLTIDSATSPKNMTTWEREPSTNDRVTNAWIHYTAGPAILQRADEAYPYGQALWTFQGNYLAGASDSASPPQSALRVELDGVHRYLSMRGNR